MRYYDISVPISPGMPVWPGDPAVEVDRVGRMEDGADANVSRLRLGSHTGTHIDPPFHFVPDGAGVDALDLETLIGPAYVADCRGASILDAEVLGGAGVPEGCRRLLVLSDNSALWAEPEHEFHRDYVALDGGGARWLLERGVRLIGLDYLSADRFGSEGYPAHHTLLPEGVIIVEGLDLRGVPPGRSYELICLPIKVAAGDGAPVRAVLRVE